VTAGTSRGSSSIVPTTTYGSCAAWSTTWTSRTRSSASTRSRPSIKAVLAAREIEYAKTHALGYLIGLVEANGIDAPPAVLEASELSPWAVDFRYETDDEPALDRVATLALIEEIRSWATAAVER
jgi:hypothetical protein